MVPGAAKSKKKIPETEVSGIRPSLKLVADGEKDAVWRDVISGFTQEKRGLAKDVGTEFLAKSGLDRSTRLRAFDVEKHNANTEVEIGTAALFGSVVRVELLAEHERPVA